jgi:hypothetical protein
MKSTTLLLPLTVALSACTYLRGAKNDPAPLCTPPRQAEVASRGVYWFNHEADSLEIGRVPDASAAGRALAGTWDIVQVATEGPAHNSIERWQLRLVATDSAVRYECWFGQPCYQGTSIPAAGAIVRAGQPFDSVAAARRRPDDSTSATIHYSETDNKLSLDFGPPEIDGERTLFGLTEVTDSTFMGRWVYGGIRVFEVNRRGVVTREQPQGFFCARRVH